MIVVTMDLLVYYQSLKPFTQMSINQHCQLCLTVIAFINLISFWSIPYDFITAHSPSCHTESNAVIVNKAMLKN